MKRLMACTHGTVDPASRFRVMQFIPHLERAGWQVSLRPNRPAVPDCGLRWEFAEWSETAETQLGLYMDIGVMPLMDTPYQRAKCGLKLLQYMAAGIPAVASPLGVNSRIIQHGRSGYLASSEAEWSDAIATLMHSPQQRWDFGQAGRARCEREYSLRRWFPVVLEILDSVAAGHRPEPLRLMT